MDLARDENIISGKDMRDRSPSRDSIKDGIVLEVPDIKQECELTILARAIQFGDTVSTHVEAHHIDSLVLSGWFIG